MTLSGVTAGFRKGVVLNRGAGMFCTSSRIGVTRQLVGDEEYLTACCPPVSTEARSWSGVELGPRLLTRRDVKRGVTE